jgi:iron complex outermembrane receptor protein
MALQDLIDIDQVEILRGPQGTLWGRNTVMGAINITTQDPSFTPGGTAEISVGDYNYAQERATVTGPVNDKVAVRLTAYNTSRDGWLKDLYDGHAPLNSIERAGAALAILLKPAPDVTVHINADYSDENDSCCSDVTTQPLKTTTGTKQYNAAVAVARADGLAWRPGVDSSAANINSPLFEHTHNFGASAQVDWLYGSYTLTSISAFRGWDFNPLQDSDDTPLDIYQVNVADTHDTQATQEFRITSPTGGPVDWQSGVFLFYQSLHDHYILHQFGSDFDAYEEALNGKAAGYYVTSTGAQYNTNVSATSASAAWYGQGTWHINNIVDFTGGLRATHDTKYGYSHYYDVGTFNNNAYAFTSGVTAAGGSVVRSEYRGNNLSGSAGLSLKLTPDELLYGTFASGYQSGGNNLDSTVQYASELNIKPVTVYDWQLGLKQSLFDHTLILDSDIYLDDIYNYQANIYPQNTALKSYLSNIKGIQARGFEVDATWAPVDNLLIHTNGDYNNAYYTSYHNAQAAPENTGASTADLTGRPVYLAPAWSGNATVQYTQPVNESTAAYAIVQYAYSSGYFSTADNSKYAWVKPYGVTNLRIGAKFDHGKYDVSVFANNLFNTHYYVTKSDTSNDGVLTGVEGDPLFVGGTVRVNF